MNPAFSPAQSGCIYTGSYFLPIWCLSETLAKILPIEIHPHSFSNQASPNLTEKA